MRYILVTLLLSVSISVSAGYKKDVMETWVDATRDELTAGWGYPQAAGDHFKVNDKTTIYTYRSNRNNVSCVISFTIRNDIVVGYKYEGGNCPRKKRKK